LILQDTNQVRIAAVFVSLSERRSRLGSSQAAARSRIKGL
jgi:hypothetical protein